MLDILYLVGTVAFFVFVQVRVARGDRLLNMTEAHDEPVETRS